jgi:hypothetical protein
MLIRPVNDLRKAIQAARNQGVRRTADLIAEALAARLDQRFDHTYGVETSKYVKLSRLGFDAEDQRLSRDYAASPVRTLRCLLSRLPRNLRSFTFIDFGSGKGRTLMVASDYAFRRIVGVEFSDELHRIAEANLRSYRSRRQRCHDLASVCARAEDFPLPDGDLVLYFFNPFEPELMQRVLGNATAAWRQTPRTIYLLFIRMRFRAVVERCEIFREIRLRRMPFDPARPSGYDAAIFVTSTR